MCTSRSTASSRSATPWLRRRPRCGAACLSRRSSRHWPMSPPRRCGWRSGTPPGGPTLLVDCYNANPASAEAALRSLAALPATRRVALLGVMAELGADTASEHRRIASVAAALGIEVVGYDTDLYGGPIHRRDRRGGGVAPLGRSHRRRAGQREQGGPAGGRRGGVRRSVTVGDRHRRRRPEPVRRARRRGSRSEATASFRGRGRRRVAGNPATRVAVVRRRLRPPRPPSPTARAPRCRARRAWPARAHGAPARKGPTAAASRARVQAASTRTAADATTMALGLPPGVPRQRVGQRLALDEFERSPEVRHGELGIVGALSLVDQSSSSIHVHADVLGHLVEAEARRRGEQRLAVVVRAHRPSRRVRRVEQGLGRRVGVGRAQDTGAQPVARHRVGMVERKVGHQLDGAPGPVRREFFAQAVEARRGGEQSHVDRAREQGRGFVDLLRFYHRRCGVSAPSSGDVSSWMVRDVSTSRSWGRTTLPMGWIEAPWRSTSTVRSLGATGVVVTTAVVPRRPGIEV